MTLGVGAVLLVAGLLLKVFLSEPSWAAAAVPAVVTVAVVLLAAAM